MCLTSERFGYSRSIGSGRRAQITGGKKKREERAAACATRLDTIDFKGNIWYPQMMIFQSRIPALLTGV